MLSLKKTSPILTLQLKKMLSAFFVLSGVVLYLYGGLITSFPIQNHETPNLYYRIHQYVAEIASNGFPPSLFPDAMYGGGFAFPMFYPPLSYLIAAFLAAVCDSYYLAGNMALFLSVLVSAYAAFWGFSQISRYSTALTASVLYVTIPYRFVDAMARGALAESWIFSWFPIIFCGGILLLKGEHRRGFVLLALASACLLLTHAVMAIYFLGICIIIFIITTVFGRRFAALGYAVAGLAFSAALCAWYILPQQMLWHTVKASNPELMSAVLEGVQSHNASFSQLFFTDSDRWLSSSNPGVVNDYMSFELGYANFVTAFLLVLGGLWLSYRTPDQQRWERLIKWGTVVAWISCIIFVLRSQWFLKFAPDSLLFIQFSWRMLGIVAFFCVASYVVALNSFRTTYRSRITISIIAMVGSIASVDSIYRVVEYHQNYITEPLDAEKIKSEGERGFVDVAEYIPHDFVQHEIQRLKSQEPVYIGSLDFTVESATHSERIFNVTAQTSSTLILPLVAYPLYNAVTSDGRNLELSSHNGLLTIVGIQPGDKTVILKRVLSKPQVLGLMVTTATFVLFIVILFLPVWNVGKRQVITEKV